MGRPSTISVKELRRDARRGVHGPLEEPIDVERPKTRADCENGCRPCPFVGCKYHLYLDVSERGSIQLNHPDKEPDELEHSCALDIADAGGTILEDVGKAIGVTRERIRQIETLALEKVRQATKEEED